MDWLLDVFATWLYGLKVIAITLAVIMFISGLDDFETTREAFRLGAYEYFHKPRIQSG